MAITQPSEYLQHLPALMGAGVASDGSNFLGDYLKIFEALIKGREDALLGPTRVRGLEERIRDLSDFFDPAQVPDATDGDSAYEHLDNLAGWVGLLFDRNWDLEQRRAWLQGIVSLYKLRGTLVGLCTYLEVFVGEDAKVDEPPGAFIVAGADSSTVGRDTFIGGAQAHYFRVRVRYGFPADELSPGDWLLNPFDLVGWLNTLQGTRRIVNLEKPAHTFYTLDARTPGFVVGRRATVARDTLLWNESGIF